jgi:hypothetical protein
MRECCDLQTVCQHTHSRREWNPVKTGGKTFYPTSDEQEYSAALAWATGLRIMAYLHRKGRVAVQPVTDITPLFRESGDRTQWLQYSLQYMRHMAMEGMGTRVGIHPPNLRIPLRKLQNLTDAEAASRVLYIGSEAPARPKGRWAIRPTTSYGDAELATFEFMQSLENAQHLKELKCDLAAADVIVCNCQRGYPCHGEFLLHLVRAA